MRLEQALRELNSHDVLQFIILQAVFAMEGPVSVLWCTSRRSGGAVLIVKATLRIAFFCDSRTMEENTETATLHVLLSAISLSLPHNFEVQLLYLTTIFLLLPCLLFMYSSVQYMNKLNAEENSIDTGGEEHQNEMVFQDSQQQSKLLVPISLKVLLKKQVM